jgi:nitronate monooxygenase
MPYKLSEIAASYGVNYLPIVSSGRAFRALWKRAIPRRPNGWRRWSMRIPGWPAGITACRTPRTRCKPQDPYPRVKALRETMREGGISDSVPIIMAGGVWYLRDWDNWIDNPELGRSPSSSARARC